MKNKRGQIETVMLVLIAIALAGAALYAMTTFNGDFKFKSADIDQITQKIEILNEYILAQSRNFGSSLTKTCPSCSQQQLTQRGQEFDAKHLARTQDDGNFFAKLRNGEFTFSQQGNEYQLKIENVYLKVSKDYNRLERNFTICQTFNQTGDFVSDC